METNLVSAGRPSPVLFHEERKIAVRRVKMTQKVGGLAHLQAKRELAEIDKTAERNKRKGYRH